MGNIIKEQISLMERMGEVITESNFLRDFFPETNNKTKLASINETNAKRLLDRHTKNGYVIISPCRGFADFGLNPETDAEKLQAVNNKRVKELYDAIIAAGFSFTPSYGGFIENQGESDEETVYEKSFIIYPFDREGKQVDFQSLYDFAIEAAKKYNQDSVLIAKPGENPKYITQSGNVDMEFTGDTTFNDATETFFTDLHKNTHKSGLNGKPTRFSFHEAYINPAPQCMSEATVRGKKGEIFIPYLKG